MMDEEGWKEFTGSEVMMLRWREKLRRKRRRSSLREKNSPATTMRGGEWGVREGLQQVKGSFRAI